MADDIKPWTIKGVEPEARNAAIAAAGRADMNIGEWLVRAIRTQVQADAGAQRAPAVVNQSPSPPPAPAYQPIDAAELEKLVALAGDKPPRSMKRMVSTIIKQRLQAAIMPPA